MSVGVFKLAMHLKSEIVKHHLQQFLALCYRKRGTVLIFPGVRCNLLHICSTQFLHAVSTGIWRPRGRCPPFGHHIVCKLCHHLYERWHLRSIDPVRMWNIFLAFADGRFTRYSCFCQTVGRVIFWECFWVDASWFMFCRAELRTLLFTLSFHTSLESRRICSSVSASPYCSRSLATPFPQFDSNGKRSCCRYTELTGSSCSSVTMWWRKDNCFICISFLMGIVPVSKNVRGFDVDVGACIIRFRNLSCIVWRSL